MRYVARVVRWSVTAAVAAAGLLWGAMALDLIPQVRIVTVDQMQAAKHSDATVATAPSAAEQSAIDAGSTTVAPAVQVQPDKGAALGDEDQAAPVELKSESQLNSLMQ